MKMTAIIGSAVLAAGLLAGTAGTASAQSDRTLGVDCTVAGHIHCGEDGPIYGSAYGWRYRPWRDGYGPYAYAGDCRLIRQRIETPSGRVIYRSRRVCG
jgi:hypothetical protein